MATPIKKTQVRTNQQQVQSKKEPKKTDGNQQTQQSKKKQKVYGQDASGRKIDVTSVFDQIKKNTKQDNKEHDQFMHDMFGDVL